MNLNHDYESHGIAEWSDTYKCSKCGDTVTYAAEDMVSAQRANELNGECQGATMAYGEYASAGRCLGKCLYQLSKMGMPLHIVETVVFDNTHKIEYCKKPFASYQWLEDDTPVFTFDPSYESAVTYTAMQLEWFKRYQPAALEFIQTEIKPAKVRTHKDFLDKWNSPGIAAAFGEYWTKTPSLLYWCLAYDYPESRLIECAKDLVAVSPGEYNTSVLHARNLISSSIGRN